MEQLLDDIERHLSREGQSASAFGEAAVGDRKLVFDLRSGRRVWPETEQKIRDFMTNGPEQEDAA